MGIFFSKNRQISYPKLNHGIRGFFFHIFNLQKLNPIFEKINQLNIFKFEKL